MAVRRTHKVAKAETKFPTVITDAMVHRWQEEAIKEAAPPCVNLYGTGRPPKGHRADCHPNQIKIGKCTCRRIAAYKKGGMAAVDKMMKGEQGWSG